MYQINVFKDTQNFNSILKVFLNTWYKKGIMANQIFGRYSRCCRTFFRLMAITRRPSLHMQSRCTYGSDAKDGDKSNKNKTGDQSEGKAFDSHKTKGNDSQINARKCSEQDKTKSKNVLLNNSLKVHAIYENKFQEKATNPGSAVEKHVSSNDNNDLQKTVKFSGSQNQSTRTESSSDKTVTDRMSKDKAQLGSHHSEPFAKNVSEKQKIENMSKELQAKIDSDEKKTIASSKIIQELKNTDISAKNQKDKNTPQRTEFISNKSVSNIGISTESNYKVQQSLAQGKAHDNTVSGQRNIEKIKPVDTSKLTQDLQKDAKTSESNVDKIRAQKTDVTSNKSVSDGKAIESNNKVQQSLGQGEQSDNTVTGKQKIENISIETQAKPELDKKKGPVISAKITEELKNDAKSTANQVDKTEVLSNKSVSDGISTESIDKVQKSLGQADNTVSGKRKNENVLNESQASPEIIKEKGPVDSTKVTPQGIKTDTKSTENQVDKIHPKTTEVTSNKSVADGMSTESKNKAKLSLGQGEPSEKNVSVKQMIENNSMKLKEKTEPGTNKEPIELINIIRGQCDIIEKLRSKFGEISQLADNNNMKTLNSSEVPGKSSTTDKESQSSENSLDIKKTINNDKLETIKILGGIPDPVAKAKKAKENMSSQRNYDTTNSKKLEGVKIMGGIPKTVAKKAEHSKVSQRSTSGQAINNKTGKKKIRGKALSGTQPTETVTVNLIEKPIDQTDTTSTASKLNNEQLKSEEIAKKSFNLSYISQQDIDKWKKIETDALNEGKTVAMSVEEIPQSHLVKTLGKDFRIKTNKYFTFDQILSMTDKKFINKKTESKVLTESNPHVENADFKGKTETKPHVENADIKGKKDTLPFEKTKETSDLASKTKEKDQKGPSAFKETPKTIDKMDEHMTFPKTLTETSDRNNINNQKDSETKAWQDNMITAKTTGDYISQSSNNEFTKEVEPVDLTKKPLRGTVAVLLEANNKKRMEELSKSLNLRNEESQNQITYQPMKFVDQSQENMAQNQSQPTPCTKNEIDTVEFSKSASDQMTSKSQEQKECLNSVEVKSATDVNRNTSYSFTPNSNLNASETSTEESHEEKTNETVNPNIETQSAIDVMISKIKEQKKLSNSVNVKSATPEKSQNTSYSYTPNANLNADDAISELKKKIESIKKSENKFASEESSFIEVKRIVKPSQFMSTDSNLNLNNSEIKADCNLTPGDLYNTHNETVTCDSYTESQNSGLSDFKLNEDILPKRWKEKKSVKNDKSKATGKQPEVATYKKNKSDESEEDDKNVDNSNDSDRNFSRPISKKKITEKVATKTYEGYNMIGDKKEENVDIEPDLYFSEPKATNENSENPEDNQSQAAEDNISFAEFFSKKLKELYKLDESKIENPNEAPPTPNDDQINLKETPKEENKAQPSDNLKESQKEENKAQLQDTLKKTPKEDDKEPHKQEKVLAAEAKKTLSDYLFTLVNGKNNNPGSKRDFGTYSLAQNFSSSVFPPYWPHYWRRFINRLSELIKKQPTDVFISPGLKSKCLDSQVIVKKRLDIWKILSGVNDIETKAQTSMEISEEPNSKMQYIVQDIRDKRFAHVNRLVSIRRTGRS